MSDELRFMLCTSSNHNTEFFRTSLYCVISLASSIIQDLTGNCATNKNVRGMWLRGGGMHYFVSKWLELQKAFWEN
jgi:hypothetical protein